MEFKQKKEKEDQDRLKGKFACTLRMNKDNSAVLIFEQILEYIIDES